MRQALVALLVAGCATPSAKVSPAPPSVPSTPAALVCPSRALEPVVGEVREGQKVGLVCVLGVEGDEKARVEKVVASRAGAPLDPEAVTADLKAVMVGGTVRDVVVASAPCADRAGCVVLVYQVDPYPPIGKVTTSGLTALPAELKLARNGKPPPASALTARVVEQDLRRAYEQLGYRAAKVSARLEPRSSGEVELLVDVVEGPRTVLKKLTLVGNKVVPTKDLRRALVSVEGAPYLVANGEKDVQALESVYFDRGFILVKLAPREPVPVGTDGLESIIDITEGPQFRVGRISLKGSTDGDQQKLLKLVRAKPGDVFSRTALRDDIARVQEASEQSGAALVVTPVSDVDEAKRLINLTLELAPSGSQKSIRF